MCKIACQPTVKRLTQLMINFLVSILFLLVSAVYAVRQPDTTDLTGVIIKDTAAFIPITNACVIVSSGENFEGDTGWVNASGIYHIVHSNCHSCRTYYSVNAPGYYPRIVFTDSAYLDSNLRKTTLNVSLIDTLYPSALPVTVQVNGSSEPLPLSGYCISLRPVGKETPVIYDTTDENGCVVFPQVAISPYADYRISVSLTLDTGFLFSAHDSMDAALSVRDTVYTFNIHSTGADRVAVNSANRVISCNPNPFSGAIQLRLNVKGKKSEVAVFSLTGQKVFNADLRGAKEISWRPSYLASGLYLLKAIVDGRVFTKSIIYIR